MKKFIIILGMILLIFHSKAFAQTPFKTNEIYLDIYSLVENDEELKFKEITFSKFVYESGWFKNMRYNNFTGMKYNSRKFVSGRTSDGYAKYNSLEDCFNDYKAWQIKHLKNIHSEQSYITILKKVYCSKNENYVKNIFNIKRKIFGNKIKF
jgi:hypothetical protein